MRNILLLVLVTILCAGCGNKVRMHGKVTYADDGSPLPGGLVLLESDTFMARGTVMPDGTFTVESSGKNDGLPVGNYKVSISGAMKETGIDRNGRPVYEYYIDPKYADAATSGLALEVTSKTTVYEIQVERYNGKK